MRRRYGVIGGVLAALLVTAFAGVRVFRPADTLDPARIPYPAPVSASRMFYGEVLRAPLFVADRLRVYASDNRVWADATPDAKMTTSAYWALRRWPAQLVGVAVAADRIVVSQWSDGQVIGQRPDTGAIVWRVPAGTAQMSYGGRRTGAQTVYDPPDLLTATASDGRPVVVAIGRDAVTGLDADTGTVRWRRSGSCSGYFTVPGAVVSLSCKQIWDAGTGTARSWPDLHGATTPVGCAIGHSRCTGLAGDGTPGWLVNPDGTLTVANGLSHVDSHLVGHIAVRVEDGYAVGYDAVSGLRQWTRPADGAVVLAVEPGAVHLLTPDHYVVTLDPSTGDVRSSIYAHIPQTTDTPWVAGYGYAHDGYVVIERVRPGVGRDQPDDAYYYPVPSLVMTGS